jgi:hypothetical protein
MGYEVADDPAVSSELDEALRPFEMERLEVDYTPEHVEMRDCDVFDIRC